MIRHAVLFAIRLYQVHLSPRKGFSCAHAAVHGGPSCSSAVAQIIASHGVWHGRRPIEQRFIDCRSAAQVIARQPPNRSRGALDCDFGLSGCIDGPDIGACSGGSDATGESASGCLPLNGIALSLDALSLRRLVFILLLVLTTAGAVKAYFHGSTVQAIAVTKTANLPDEELGLIDRVLSGGELRYFIVLEKNNGQRVESDAVSGDFAQGIVFRPLQGVRVGQVKTLTLKRKQALMSEDLVSLAMAANSRENSSEDSRYRIVVQTNWSVFARELE